MTDLASRRFIGHGGPASWYREADRWRLLEPYLSPEATGVEVGAVAVVRGAQHPQWARRYVDFAVSAKGQQVAAEIGAQQLPTRSDLRGDPRLMPPSTVPLLKLPPFVPGQADPDAPANEPPGEALVRRFAEEVAP